MEESQFPAVERSNGGSFTYLLIIPGWGWLAKEAEDEDDDPEAEVPAEERFASAELDLLKLSLVT